MSRVYENFEAAKYCSFKIGGRIKKAVFPQTTEEFTELLKTGGYDLVLGNCTNILFSSFDIDKSIIFTKDLNDFSMEGNKITVSAGVSGSIASRAARDKGLSGFEFLIGLPGSFGGMIAMNASAHGQAVSDCIVSADIFDTETKKVMTLSKNELCFEYRNSAAAKKNYIVLSAEFELAPGSKDDINKKMQRNLEFRKQRQPLNYPNAGSIFKNPENNSAGALLDLCGLKGEKQGGAMVSEKHANFIVNIGNASSKDVLTLMYKMFSKVKERHKIELKPEIKYIGVSEGQEGQTELTEIIPSPRGRVSEGQEGVQSEENGLWKKLTQNSI